MVSELQLNEKKDACYHKVKSRYKVWPSAYASGALVRCRKKGAANWGNKSNESITQEEYEQLDENLKKWFSDKWVRFGPDGKIKGDCARGSSSEGKPKCLPQSKAYSLGKKGRAAAAARKRREDPNPERSGKAINFNTKKESNEETERFPTFKENYTNITPNHIHKLADHKGIKWDNEPSFLELTKRLTGKEHLDDLNQSQLQRVKNYLERQDMTENFADGKNPEHKGDSKRYGVPTKSSVSNLRKVAKQGGRKGQLAHWMANMKAGKAKKK
jgi:hypothetical protein